MPSSDPESTSPFHAGEQELQRRTGKREVMEAFGSRVIRPFLPDQHRVFFEQLPFLVVGAVDRDGWPWAGLLSGAPGFVTSPDPRHLHVAPDPTTGDPVRAAITEGAALGVLGIELHSRRRNRVNGRIAALSQGGFTLAVDQSFGNCPQYIQLRGLTYPPKTVGTPRAHALRSLHELEGKPARLIEAADVFFVSSYVPSARHPEKEGVDVSHRGGRPGFVGLAGETLTIPDFPGNNHFNTLGNFLLTPRAGLVFADFESGSLLQLTGTVEVLDADDPEIAAFQGAERGWRFTLHSGVWREGALPFRAEPGAPSPNSLLTDTWQDAKARDAQHQRRDLWRPVMVARIEDESATIRSFYLEPLDGAPLAAFEAGQFLTLGLNLPEHDRPVIRTYTLSSAPGEPAYRISVKKEPHGTASNHLHRHVRVGDVLDVKAPRGAFHLAAKELRSAVLIGGGVGITPMIAMARHVAREGLRRRHLRPVTVLHAARSIAERAFAGEFRELEAATNARIRYLSVLSAPTEADRADGADGAETDIDLIGRIDASVLRATLPLEDHDFYLCGPEGFMQTVYDALLSLGVRDGRIYAEAFGPSALKRRVAVTSAQDEDAEAGQAVVRFAGSGVETPWQAGGGTLLDLAEDHGLAPDFGCRSGACGTCARRLIAGAVTYRTAPAEAPPEGEVLICCAVPAKGTKTVELDL